MELKDLLDLLEIEVTDKDTVDTVKEKLHGTWITRKMAKSDPDLVKEIAGKAIGSFSTTFKKLATGTGIELPDAELKDKKVEEIMELAFGKVDARIKELDEKSKTGNDSKVKKAEDERDTWKTKAGEFENLHKTVKGQLETKETEFNNQVKSFKLNHKLGEVEAKIPFSEAATELVKLGFKTQLDQKYIRDLDENDNIIVIDRSTKERVKNEKNTDHASWEEVLTREAKAAKIYKENDAARNDTKFKQYTPGNQGGGNNGGGERTEGNRIHPRAQG